MKVQLTMPVDLHDRTDAAARAEAITFDSFVCRAIERDLLERRLQPVADSRTFLTPAAAAFEDEIIPITEVARRLRISVFTVRRRAGRRGDPLRLARSRIGKQRPMHFRLSKIREMERGGEQ